MTPSIRHKPHKPSPTTLPDFRNLGVWLRILLGVNLLALLWALVRTNHLLDVFDEFVAISLWVEPPLFVLLPLLHGLQPRLARLPYRYGQAAVVSLAVITCIAQHGVFMFLLQDFVPPHLLLRTAIWAGLASLAMLTYFSYLATLYSPALAEARLLALTARIRPHFLYNSLNAVLGVIRHDPRRAEAALEELSDLFRVLMKENRELTLLSEEIALARQYLDLERLRLGDRLKVDWQIDACPPDTLMPPLMLQPLLENAVYHGIEPAPGDATVTVLLTVAGNRLCLRISNPRHGNGNGHGNHMALANIRERLMLFYDLEASLDTQEGETDYAVVITLPLKRKGQI